MQEERSVQRLRIGDQTWYYHDDCLARLAQDYIQSREEYRKGFYVHLLPEEVPSGAHCEVCKESFHSSKEQTLRSQESVTLRDILGKAVRDEWVRCKME